MNSKGVGAVFCLTAGILFAARYIAAAIYMSASQTWSAELFNAGLEYVGSTLQTMAMAAFVVGVVFIVLGFILDAKNKD